MTTTNPIIEVARVNTPTLAVALQAANLIEALQETGPFTIFAPINEAFSSIQPIVDNLLKAENRVALQAVLNHHVVPGNIRSSDFRDGQHLSTLDGPPLLVAIDGHTLKVGGATVLQADLEATNGTVHLIDTILMA